MVAAAARPRVMARITGRMIETRFWAERGLVCFERRQRSTEQHDEYQVELIRDGAYGQMTVDDAYAKLLEVQRMLRGHGTLDKGVAKDLSEKRMLMRFCRDMEDVIRLAREQGTYDDPTAIRDYQILAPKSLFIPGQPSQNEKKEILVPGVNC